MKRLLSLLACGVLAAAFLAVADTVSVTATEGYKVYPFSLYTNPNSSVDLKMTPDGGYTISKNPGNSATVGNISFLVSDSVDSIDYEAMHYLYLNNLDTSAPIFVKATFVSNIYPVADTWGGTMVYDKGTVAVPEANSTIAIDLKTAMSDTCRKGPMPPALGSARRGRRQKDESALHLAGRRQRGYDGAVLRRRHSSRGL